MTLLVVLVAFVFSCGGQWPMLQCVAWANMIREYSEVVPVPQAIEMTFSGKYPCAMCKMIAEKKEAENAKVAVLFQHEKKLTSPGFFVKAPATTEAPQDFVSWTQDLQARSEAPPTPPPRIA